MKINLKIFFSLIIAFFILILENTTFAASTSVSASSTNIKVGESTTISAKVSSTEAWNLKLSASGGSLSGTTSVADSAGLEVSQTVMTATFSATSAGTYNISLSGTITGSDLNKRAASGSVTINVTNPSSSSNNGSSSSNSGSNNSGSTSSGSSSGSTTSSKSSNANLKMLATSPVDFSGFKASTTKYNITVENSVTKVDVTATTQDSKASYKVSGNTNLKEGSNKITVIVTAEDGSTQKYYIYATRKTSGEETVTPNVIDEKKEEKPEKLRLTNIVLDNSLNIKLTPEFNPEVFEYTIELAEEYKDLEKMEIGAIANLNSAKVEIKGNEEIIDGENVVTITISAEGYETVTYKVKILRNVKKEVETVAAPINNDISKNYDLIDNSEQVKKTRIIIGTLTILIALVGIIFAVKEYIEKKDKTEKVKRTKSEKVQKNADENILGDIYSAKNVYDNIDVKEGKTEDLSRKSINNRIDIWQPDKSDKKGRHF